MRKLLYILPIILIIGVAACENYVDITHGSENRGFYPNLLRIGGFAEPDLSSDVFCIAK